MTFVAKDEKRRRIIGDSLTCENKIVISQKYFLTYKMIEL